MSEDQYLSIKNLFNESILRKIILFVFIYLLLITQEWINIFLLLFPLITFISSLFFEILNVNKWRIRFPDINIAYNPFGSERKNANRLFFTSIFTVVLLLWFGAESLSHPQLIDNYSFFFLTLFIIPYNFTFFWIFVDIWKFSRFKISIHEPPEIPTKPSKLKEKNDFKDFLSQLRFSRFKLIGISSFLIFFLLTLINIIYLMLSLQGVSVGFAYPLPGTGIEDSQPLFVPYSFLISFIGSPASMIIFLTIVYSDINSINFYEIQKYMENLPDSLRKKIFTNLRSINQDFKKDVGME